jgi:hypothetical protein
MKNETNSISPKIGDKLAGSYGYDANIYDFYIVLNVTKTQVTVQPVASKTLDFKNGGMDWTSTPIWNCPTGKPIKKKFKVSENSYYLTIGPQHVSPTTKEVFKNYNHH